MTAIITPDEAKDLPIRRHAQEIIDAVKEHPTVIVLGETGSGKTTQISQILYEAGFAKEGQIAITQPRRVAAVTVAKRVAEEMGVELGRQVGYSVRFEDCSSPDTKIKYLTDGTLLRECLDDAQLSKYSVIVLDEAHERSLSTDILFGVIKKLVKERKQPLKLVVTSATLDGEKFSAYFDACPVFSVPGRCYPVDVIHTMEDHTSDYVDAAVDVVLQLHTQQPPGDILVFLTGQAEIDKCLAKLSEGVASLPDGSCGPLLLLPLYASLPPEMQVRVFRPPPQGTRRCIVATNVAETSVTVDGVVYVVDSGMVKLKSYVPSTGMDSLDVTPTSRVGATQRAGRAGRTRPGKCFRLYTKQFFDRHMPDVTPPEIQRTSLAGTVLHLKSLALDIDVLNFDFLDPPSKASLEDALRTLHLLDALDESGHVTETGRAMAALPLEPGLARCLLAAIDLKCLSEAISMAAMLSTEHVFEQGRGPADSRPGQEGGERHGGRGGHHNKGPSQKLKALMAEGLGDHVLMLRLWDLWAGSGYDKKLLHEYGLDVRGMRFAKDVRRQLEGIMSGYVASRRKGQPIGGRLGVSSVTSAAEQPEPSASNAHGGRDDDGDVGNHQLSSHGKYDRDRRAGRDGDRHDRRGRSRSRSKERHSSRDRHKGRQSRSRSRSRDRHRDRERGRHGSRSPDRGGHRGGRDEEGRRRQEGVGSQRGGEGGMGPGGGQEAAAGGGLPGPDPMKPYPFPSEVSRVSAAIKAVTIGYAHKLARRLPRHNGYRTLGTGAQVGGGQLAQLHPTCAGLAEDEDGLLPEWVVYHELVSTSRPFLRQVCATQYSYVEPLLTKIAKIDVIRLSRGRQGSLDGAAPTEHAGAAAVAKPAAGTAGVATKPAKKDDKAVEAARLRYLQRKAQAGKG